MATSLSAYPTNSLLAFEIAQQPTLWATTLERVLATDLDCDWSRLPIILTGAGTSAYAASTIAEAWPGAAAIPTTDLLLLSAAELLAAMPSLAGGGTMISLARSGDSPESAAVVEKFQRHFPAVRHIAIVCNAEGRLARLPRVQVVCLDPRTNDRSLAMTGSFSNLVLGGLLLMHRQELGNELPGVCHRVEQSLLQLNHAAQQIAAACDDRIVILTSAMQALAREAVLKIVELTAGRIIAMPETFLGFRHGAVGFLRKNTPVLCILSRDPQKRIYEEDVLADLRARGLGRLIIVDDGAFPVQEGEWHLPAMAAGLPDSLRTPFEIVCAQLIAFHLSVHTLVDPDNPSPDGAITRVVRPFQIHPESAHS